MEKRSKCLLAASCVFFIGILRCSTHGDAPPIGLDEVNEFGVPPPTITAPTSISVVRGESTTVPIMVSAATFAGLSGLPAGVTASAFSGTEIVLTADINAPAAKATVTLSATTTNTSTISKTVTVYVTGIDGSRDPTFSAPWLGADGVGLAVLSDGRTIALTRNAALSRFTSSGTSDASFGAGGRVTLPFTYAYAIDFAADGHMAIAGTSGVVVVSADGAIERNITLGTMYPNVRVIWNGPDIVLVDSNLMMFIDASGNVTSSPLPAFNRHAYYVPTNSRIALTNQASSPDGGGAAVQITMLVLAQGAYAVDTTFGSSGVSTFATSDPEVPSMATTSVGALMVETSKSDIVRLDGSGALDTAWGQQGYVSITQMPGMILTTPSNRVLVTGVTYDQSVVAVERFLPDGTLDPAFGYEGRAVTDVTMQPNGGFAQTPVAAIDALETVLYVAIDGWLLRYRIHA
jgi:hypothetical protein